MARALILNAVDPRIGGVLIRGERGTAKSTAARALAALLPPIEVVENCRFNCDPHKPTTWCTECQERFIHGEDPLPHAHHATPFVNLPVSATEDRVVGTLDIERAIQKGAGSTEADQLEELTFEAYGPNGHPILILAITDNRNRTLAEIKHILTKYEGKLGTSGSVLWMFEQKGKIVLKNKE